MIRFRRRVRLQEIGRRELRGVLGLVPVFLGTAMLVFVLWGSGIVASGALFQSPPESPLATDTATPTEAPTEAPTLAPTLTATSAPTSAPTVTPTIEATDPAATATPPVEPSPTPVVPTHTTSATTEPSSTPTEALPPATVTVAAPASTDVIPNATTDPSQRYPEEDTGLSFDWAMLFDSLALGASYVWLCCGILLLLGIPAVFVALWAAAKRRSGQEE